MTFEELRKANELIKTIPIEKKDKKTGTVTTTAYSPVHQRILAFRSVYPDGMILPELISCEGGVYVFKCTVMTPDGVTLGVGHASEKDGSSFINSTSALENAETSAVGRALGMAGFGIDGGLASAEEVQNAMLNQGMPSRVEPKKAIPKPDTNSSEAWAPEQYVPADSIICDDCMHVIKGANGWTPEKIASYSEKRFGRRLCVDCQKREQRKDA